MLFQSELMQSRAGAHANPYLYNGKEKLDMPGGWYSLSRTCFGNYGARMYDAQLGRWHTIDKKCEKYYSITVYAYVENNPLLFIDPNGLKKYKFKISGKVTTGKVGVEGKVEGVGIGGNYNLGGGEIQVSLYLSFDTDTKLPGIGISFTNSLVEEGSYSATIGPFSGGVESKKDITSLDLNTTDGFTQKSDNKFKKTESGGLYFFSTEETEREDTKAIFEVNAEANAAIVGVGVDLKLESSDSDSESGNDQSNPTNNQSNNDNNTIIRKKEKEL